MRLRAVFAATAIFLLLAFAVLALPAQAACDPFATPGRCGDPDIPDPNPPQVIINPETGYVGDTVFFEGSNWQSYRGALVVISVLHADGTSEVVCQTTVTTKGKISCGPHTMVLADFGKYYRNVASFEFCVTGAPNCYGASFTAFNL